MKQQVCTYLEFNNTITRPANSRREVRDATTQEQPTNTDEAVPPTSGSKIEIIQIAIHIVPNCARPDGNRSLILAQCCRVQVPHVKGHAALDVGETSRWSVTASFHGELASWSP